MMLFIVYIFWLLFWLENLQAFPPQCIMFRPCILILSDKTPPSEHQSTREKVLQKSSKNM
ncbi:unnamed protein product, partial [Sphagnum jensenii]